MFRSIETRLHSLCFLDWLTKLWFWLRNLLHGYFILNVFWSANKIKAERIHSEFPLPLSTYWSYIDRMGISISKYDTFNSCRQKKRMVTQTVHNYLGYKCCWQRTLNKKWLVLNAKKNPNEMDFCLIFPSLGNLSSLETFPKKNLPTIQCHIPLAVGQAWSSRWMLILWNWYSSYRVRSFSRSPRPSPISQCQCVICVFDMQ